MIMLKKPTRLNLKSNQINYQRSDGHYEKISLNNFKDNPILHQEINKRLLRKIRNIYNHISYVLYTECDIYTLEQFETIFMREFDIEKSVENWEMVIKIIKKYVKNYKKKHKIMFNDDFMPIIFLAYYCTNNFDFSQEEKEDELIKEIISIYKKLKNI